MNLTEKYRPKSLDEVVGQTHVTKRIQAFINDVKRGKDTMPHLLFAGIPGIGKTTVAKIIANEILISKTDYLELNASDERGINTIRDKVKSFANTTNLSNSPFGIIFLDEADEMTRDAQNALRTIMETYSNNARFIISGNNLYRIIEPIRSRCAVMRFLPIQNDVIEERLKYIVSQEGLTIEDMTLKKIVAFSNGKMRDAINLLNQVMASDDQSIDDIIGATDFATIERIMDIVMDNKIDASAAISMVDKPIIDIAYSLNMDDIFIYTIDYIKKADINAMTKANMITRLGLYNHRILEGRNPIIQLNAMICEFIRYTRS